MVFFVEKTKFQKHQKAVSVKSVCSIFSSLTPFGFTSWLNWSFPISCFCFLKKSWENQQTMGYTE
jgi:hypothetical protein